MGKEKLKVMISINSSELFLSHRVHLAKELLLRGCEVHLVCPLNGKQNEIESLGVIPHNLPLDRKGLGPQKEWESLKHFRDIVSKVNPDILHSFTLKCILYTLLTHNKKIRQKIVTITGLGSGFLSRGPVGLIVRNTLYSVFRAHRLFKLTTIFQNYEDQNLFIKKMLVSSKSSHVIFGTGIDLSVFKPSRTLKTTKKKVIFFPGRMIKDKGLFELIEASIQLHQSGHEIELLLAGPIDKGNISATPLELLNKWEQEYPFIKYLGKREDMAQLYQQADIVCLPSYREGISQSLMEGAASGKAIVTCNVAGCREVVEHGVNGYLVPPKNISLLRSHLQRLIQNDKLRNQFGEASRIKAEKEFEKSKIIDRHMVIYFGEKVQSSGRGRKAA